MPALPSQLAAYEPPGSLVAVLQTLRNHGHEAFVVGGAVRDLLCGIAPSELDLATDAPAERVAALFARVIPTGIAHGTVTVLHDGASYEVTTYRGDAPVIEEDLARRDFTVNAMAFDPLEGRFLDLHGGRADLSNRLIRAVGEAHDRFGDDPLRVMRACRFASRMGFRIERKTRRAIPAHLQAFKKVAPERIRDELSKLLVGDHPRYGMELLRRTGLLALILPELLEGLGMRQNRWHRYDVYHHVLHAVNEADPKLAVRLATLLHDVDKPTTAAPSAKVEGETTFYSHEVSGADRARAICERLRFSNRLSAKVSLLVREHQFVYSEAWSDGAVRRMLARVGEENFDDLIAVRKADLLGRAVAVEEGLDNLRALEDRVRGLLASRPALTTRDLAIGGRDVIEALSIPPSPVIGAALDHLLNEVIESPERNTREELQAILASWWKDHRPEG
ncbi:CCA tRNA nucleotidyltransferase [Vulgatibacter incomptus]|nr:CCA tRNA nucleotidyltransferase [Vulgatibacter incomptus]